MRSYFLFLLVTLAACTPARLDRSSYANTMVISAFMPDKGEAAEYKVGSQVRFLFNINRAGFLTLLSYGPTGNTAPLETNLRLLAGQQRLPRADDTQGTAQAAYVVGVPTGTNRVILMYSSTALKTVPRGRFDNSQLESAIKSVLAASQAEIIDLAETNIEVTP